MHLESLRYARPAAAQQGETAPQQPLVVNLLMQLRAYSDQSNTFLRNQATLNLQLTNQLRQVLSQSGGAARARAGEIERAVRQNLYQSGEFQRAVRELAGELKKNDNRNPELTVRLPGPGAAAAAVSGRSARIPPVGPAGARPQETPALRALAFPGEGAAASKPAGSPLVGRQAEAGEQRSRQEVRRKSRARKSEKSAGAEERSGPGEGRPRYTGAQRPQEAAGA